MSLRTFSVWSTFTASRPEPWLHNILISFEDQFTSVVVQVSSLKITTYFGVINWLASSSFIVTISMTNLIVVHSWTFFILGQSVESIKFAISSGTTYFIFFSSLRVQKFSFTIHFSVFCLTNPRTGYIILILKFSLNFYIFKRDCFCDLVIPSHFCQFSDYFDGIGTQITSFFMS